MVLTAAAIAGKFLTGLWSAPPKTPGYMLLFVQVGSAMVGRGELGFVVAKMALAMGLLHERSFSACIWALLLATILGPFMFQYFLKFDVPSKDEDIRVEVNGHPIGHSKGYSKDNYLPTATEKSGLYHEKPSYSSHQVPQSDIEV